MVTVAPADLAFVMRTLDRTPRRNYLGATLQALQASGFRGPLTLVDSSPSSWLTDAGLDPDDTWFSLTDCVVTVQPTAVSLTNNQNALRALRIGLATGRPWIVHLEDDLDVCRDLDGAIARWLTDHVHVDRHLYTFHTPYREVRQAYTRGETAWAYPIKGFYGNQCWAIRRDDAASLADYLETAIPTWSSGQGFDLLIKQWAKVVWPDIGYFLASVPSFVQHVGTESSLHFPRFHQNGSFPGRDWTYQGRETSDGHS